MNLVDVIIILFILSGALYGFKRGFTKELVTCLGFIASVILAFLCKNSISIFLYEHLPFFSFGGVFKGVTILNIILYEVIAFLLVFTICITVVKVLLLVTGIVENVLKFTILLGIPSKILGAIIGIVENFVWIFIVLYVLNLPFFHMTFIQESKLGKDILQKTPILSTYIDKSLVVIDKFVDLKEKYEHTTNVNQFNLETLDLFLEYKIITVESVEKLDSQNKLRMDAIDSVLNKYRKER